uniref:Uncharacterized protein n=1 Tax=Triticum urartu TaxID=4572 RepID=A0A8R7QA12_TRIUA
MLQVDRGAHARGSRAAPSMLQADHGAIAPGARTATLTLQPLGPPRPRTARTQAPPVLHTAGGLSPALCQMQHVLKPQDTLEQRDLPPPLDFAGKA